MNDTFPRIHKASFRLIGDSYSLRADAKQASAEVREFLKRITDQEHFFLNELLPTPFVKGIQPNYLDFPTDDSIPVVNTLSIQNLSFNTHDCRHISREDFEQIADKRKIQRNDVLLTVDGGVSIGKPYLFCLEEEYTMDSHLVILRPEGIGPLSLVYLLASRLGQIQFRRAESGASGQTTVTEDDIRRFVFPRRILGCLDHICGEAEIERQAIVAERKRLDEREKEIWDNLHFL